MFSYCRQIKSSGQLEVLQSVDTCEDHNLPLSFICLQQESQCIKNPLICMQCLQNHKTHNWQSLDKYFDADLRKALASGTSAHAKQVDDFIDETITAVDQIRAKINRRLDQINDDLRYEMEDLKQNYPYKGKFGIKGHNLNNSNVGQFREIRQREKNGKWIEPATAYMLRMFNETGNMISNLLDDFHANLTGRQWEQLTPQSSKQSVQRFLKQYEGIFSDDPHFFKFSFDQKLANIRVNSIQRQVRFVKESPSKPTVLIAKPMDRHHNIIYFKIQKLQKTIVVFDKQLIVLGVCLPKVIKNYGYRGVIQPSHGGFTIGSNGRCYHSKLYKYEKADLGFTFGKEDIVSVSIDYDEKLVKFQKMTGFFKKKFEMELGISDQQILLLKPCVMFYGEQGAVVSIIQEFETTKKYQKNKKKQKYKIDKPKK